MTIRRDISLGIQNYIGAVILRDPAVKKDKYRRHGESDSIEHGFMKYKIIWVAKQQQPYSDVYLMVLGSNSIEYWWSVGYSKCIGTVEDRPPDTWDPYEGLRLALARAATDIGKQIQEYENMNIALELEGEDRPIDALLTMPEQPRIATDVTKEEWAKGGLPIEVEIEGFENFTTYVWHDMYLVRVSDFPEHVDAINKFMRGQTRPFIDGAEPNDYIYLHDFSNFLAKGKLFWD